MNKTITHDNLFVSFLYNETSESENLTFSDAINSNSDLYESYHLSVSLKNKIDALRLCPSSQVEENILAYC